MMYIFDKTGNNVKMERIRYNKLFPTVLCYVWRGIEPIKCRVLSFDLTSRSRVLFQTMLSLCVLASVLAAGRAVRPHGVRPDHATLYNPAMDFKCFDGSNLIPFNQVNDDYCDCEDGSDEPGTAACPTGRFYCENAGHAALVLPSSRAGDRWGEFTHY